MLKEWLLDMLLSVLKTLLVKQLQELKDKIDWVKIKGDAEAWIAQVVPGDAFDDTFKKLIVVLIDEAKEFVDSHPDLVDDVLKLVEGAITKAVESPKFALAASDFGVVA